MLRPLVPEVLSVLLGVDSFVSAVTDPSNGHVVGPQERLAGLLEEMALADQATRSASGSTTAASTTTRRLR